MCIVKVVTSLVTERCVMVLLKEQKNNLLGLVLLKGYTYPQSISLNWIFLLEV